MKKTFLPKLTGLILLISFTLTSFSQSSKSAFEDSLSKEFCDVFTKSGSKINKDNITTEIGLLIVPLFGKYKEQMKTEWNLDISNEKDLDEASERIGKIGALGCPAFMDFIKNNLDALTSEDESLKTYNGKLLRVEGSPFSYLVVQNKAGKTEKIYWMEFFEGADRLSGSPASIANKPITIRFKEMEIYDATAKEYRMIKVAAKIDFN